MMARSDSSLRNMSPDDQEATLDLRWSKSSASGTSERKAKELQREVWQDGPIASATPGHVGGFWRPGETLIGTIQFCHSPLLFEQLTRTCLIDVQTSMWTLTNGNADFSRLYGKIRPLSFVHNSKAMVFAQCVLAVSSVSLPHERRMCMKSFNYEYLLRNYHK